jgi:hypothetical protein
MDNVREFPSRNGSGPAPLPVVELPRLVIQVNPNGTVTMVGPIENKILCYGLLAMARDIVKEYQPSPILKV